MDFSSFHICLFFPHLMSLSRRFAHEILGLGDEETQVPARLALSNFTPYLHTPDMANRSQGALAGALPVWRRTENSALIVLKLEMARVDHDDNSWDSSLSFTVAHILSLIQLFFRMNCGYFKDFSLWVWSRVGCKCRPAEAGFFPFSSPS